MQMSNYSSRKRDQSKKFALTLYFLSLVLPIITEDHDTVWSISEVIFDHAMTAYEKGEDDRAVRSFKAVCRIMSGMSNPVGQQVCC